MKRIPLIITAFAVVGAFGQRIETQKADRTRITRLATTQNHLSVLEFDEPVKEVAVGSSNFKVEWRENKVFVQPLEPNATTNLFIWTASGRQSYELVPASSVDQMDFAIDEDPPTPRPKLADPPPPAPSTQSKVPAAMLMESTPVTLAGAFKKGMGIEILLQDIYQKDGRVYLRYAIVNGGTTVYLPAAPEVFRLDSPHAQQSLIPLAHTQIAGDFQLRWKDASRVNVVEAELPAAILRPGQSAHGLVAFDLPPKSGQPSERTVVRLSFPADGAENVSAVLVL